jgi:hypothetical protein
MQPQIPEPPVLPSKLAQARPQLGVVASPRPIPGDRAGEADQAAGFKSRCALEPQARVIVVSCGCLGIQARGAAVS